jgi:hypothetical protein
MGTHDSSAFKDKERENGKRDILFNGPGDGSKHGHVVENTDGSYSFVRDVEGNVYIDDRQTDHMREVDPLSMATNIDLDRSEDRDRDDDRSIDR